MKKSTPHHYALYRPHGMDSSEGEELHRFDLYGARNRWVSEDPVHRTVVKRDTAERGHDGSELFRCFEYPLADQIWEDADGHEVFVGILDEALDFNRKNHVQAAPDLQLDEISVRGNGRVALCAVMADGQRYVVTWVTTSHDTAIVVSGLTAAVFEGELGEDEFYGFVRSMLADTKYDRLIDRHQWRRFYDSIRIDQPLSMAA